MFTLCIYNPQAEITLLIFVIYMPEKCHRNWMLSSRPARQQQREREVPLAHCIAPPIAMRPFSERRISPPIDRIFGARAAVFAASSIGDIFSVNCQKLLTDPFSFPQKHFPRSDRGNIQRFFAPLPPFVKAYDVLESRFGGVADCSVILSEFEERGNLNKIEVDGETVFRHRVEAANQKARL